VYNSKENIMETLDQLNTKAVIAMGEKITAYEAEIARLTKRIDDLETVIANQRAVIKELQ
jgi:uncharacterized coiled-coil protein SlyX